MDCGLEGAKHDVHDVCSTLRLMSLSSVPYIPIYSIPIRCCPCFALTCFASQVLDGFLLRLDYETGRAASARLRNGTHQWCHWHVLHLHLAGCNHFRLHCCECHASPLAIASTTLPQRFAVILGSHGSRDSRKGFHGEVSLPFIGVACPSSRHPSRAFVVLCMTTIT